MRQVAKKNILGAVFVAFLSTTAMAGDYYSDGYGRGYESRRSYNDYYDNTKRRGHDTDKYNYEEEYYEKKRKPVKVKKQKEKKQAPVSNKSVGTQETIEGKGEPVNDQKTTTSQKEFAEDEKQQAANQQETIEREQEQQRASILKDANGRTLYTFDKDKEGQSNCNKGCVESWPPYLVKEGDIAGENFTTVIRKDNRVQWAYKGQPLYYWVGDKKVGDAKGNGIGKVWHVARTGDQIAEKNIQPTEDNQSEISQTKKEEGENTRSINAKDETKAEKLVQEEKTGQVESEAQKTAKKEKFKSKETDEKAALNTKRSPEEEPESVKILTDEKGMTLYTYDRDKTDVSNCYDSCEVSWPPYLVQEEAKAKDGFVAINRKDGKKQWAYKGQPLYYWVGDQKTGDKTGDGVGGVWHIIKL